MTHVQSAQWYRTTQRHTMKPMRLCPCPCWATSARTGSLERRHGSDDDGRRPVLLQRGVWLRRRSVFQASLAEIPRTLRFISSARADGSPASHHVGYRRRADGLRLERLGFDGNRTFLRLPRRALSGVLLDLTWWFPSDHRPHHGGVQSARRIRVRWVICRRPALQTHGLPGSTAGVGTSSRCCRRSSRVSSSTCR